MPTYQYKGQYYDLSETDPAKAKAKIQAHLGEATTAALTETTTPPAQPYQRQKLSFSAEPATTFDAGTAVAPTRQQVTGEAPKDYRKPLSSQLSKEAAATGIEAGMQYGGGLLGAPLGPAGVFGGGVGGYTLGRQLTGKLGLREEEPVLTSAGTGLLYETGGQLLGKGIGKIVEKATGKGAVKAATVEELKQAETQAWDRTKQSTITFKDPVPLKDSVDKLLSPKEYNYDPRTFSSVKPAVEAFNDIYEAGLKGIPASIHEMRTVRTMLQDVRMSGGAKPDEKKLAGELMDKLDDYVIKNGGADAAAWKEARDTSNQLFRSRDVQNIVKAAEESSEATSKEIRSKFKNILDSNQIKMYTPEQQAIIKQIADGTATQKTLEFVGGMAPKSVGFQKILALLGYGGTGAAVAGPYGAGAALAAFGTGAAARGTANALARQRVNMLDELIRGGQMPQTIQLPQTTQRLLPAGVNVLANQLQGQQ